MSLIEASARTIFKKGCPVCSLPGDLLQAVVNLRFEEKMGLQEIAAGVNIQLGQRGREDRIKVDQLYRHYSEHMDLPLAIQSQLVKEMKNDDGEVKSLTTVDNSLVQVPADFGPFGRALMAERLDFYRRGREQLVNQESLLAGSQARLRALGMMRGKGGNLPLILRNMADALENPPVHEEGGETIEVTFDYHNVFEPFDDMSKIVSREVLTHSRLLKQYHDSMKTLMIIESPKQVMQELVDRLLYQMISRLNHLFFKQIQALENRLKRLPTPEDARCAAVASIQQSLVDGFSADLGNELDRVSEQIKLLLDESESIWTR